MSLMRALLTRRDAWLAIMMVGAIAVAWLTEDAGWDSVEARRLLAVRFLWGLGVVAAALGRPLMRWVQRLEKIKRRRERRLEAVKEEERVAALRAIVRYSTTSKDLGRRGT